MSTALVIMAKRPVAGRSKTRLCPPCTPEEAAGLAAAALRDTIDAACGSGAERLVLAMDECSSEWDHPDFEMIEQRGGDLAERLRGVVHDVAAPLVLVGMDTPQVTVAQLAGALAAVRDDTAQLGLAHDGGWWAIGLSDPCGEVFDRVPMSRSDTGRRQIESLRRRFDTVEMLPTLRDVDHWNDALAVADDAPDTRFATSVRQMAARAGGAS